MKAKLENVFVLGYEKVDMTDGGAWHRLNVSDGSDVFPVTVPEGMVQEVQEGYAEGDPKRVPVVLVDLLARAQGGSKLRLVEVPASAAARPKAA